MEVERTRYEAARAERRYRAVDPENRLVARGLEAEWEQCLKALNDSQEELARRQQERPHPLEPADRDALIALGTDLRQVWHASTTTARDKKELLRTVLQDVTVRAPRDGLHIHLILHWLHRLPDGD